MATGLHGLLQNPEFRLKSVACKSVFLFVCVCSVDDIQTRKMFYKIQLASTTRIHTYWLDAACMTTFKAQDLWKLWKEHNFDKKINE